MNLKFLIIIGALSAPTIARAQDPVHWHNEANDTTAITEILTETASQQFRSPSERTGNIARRFIGTPYVAHTLEIEPEALTVNLDELDCTTFVDIVLAFSFTVAERRLGWQDFLYNLKRMRYRNGMVAGYSSRLHYNCDWAMDNIHRGNLIDATSLSPKCSYVIRSIDFMSGHRDKYAALADSAQFARIVSVENGYRNHRFPYIKVNDLSSKDVQSFLREGDVVAFVSNRKDLDVTHLGIVVKEKGQTRVLHASSIDGVVEISDAPISDFVKRNRNWIGVRVYRLKE